MFFYLLPDIIKRKQSVILKLATASYCDYFYHCENIVSYCKYCTIAEFHFAAAIYSFTVHLRFVNEWSVVLCTRLNKFHLMDNFWSL